MEDFVALVRRATAEHITVAPDDSESSIGGPAASTTTITPSDLERCALINAGDGPRGREAADAWISTLLAAADQRCAECAERARDELDDLLPELKY